MHFSSSETKLDIHVDALAIMTISDSLVNPDEDTTAEERQNTFTDMMKVGLETLIAD